MTVGHALQDVSEPGKGLDIVEFCGGDNGADGGPPRCRHRRSLRTEWVLRPSAMGRNGALDRVVVQFDATVLLKRSKGNIIR